MYAVSTSSACTVCWGVGSVKLGKHPRHSVERQERQVLHATMDCKDRQRLASSRLERLMEVGRHHCRKERVSCCFGSEKQSSMMGANPSEEFRHTYPYPALFPLNSSPSPSISTPSFLLKTSLIVERSSGTLLQQDYRKIHRQEQVTGRLAIVLSQSLPNRAKSPKLHQPQSPNLQPLPSRSQPPTATASQASAQLLALSWYHQDQTSHGNKAAALIQHRPALVAISDPNSHNHPLLRPITVSRPPPKAVSKHLI